MMLTKLGILVLLFVRDWPEYLTPIFEIPFGKQLIRHLIEQDYLSQVPRRTDYGGLYNAVRLTPKGADAIADNFDWLTARGYKL